MAKIGPLRTVLLLVMPIVLAVWCAGTAVASTSVCVAPGDSALNQYCETIPAAGGGQRPGGDQASGIGQASTTPPRTVASTMSPAAVRQITAAGPRAAARRALLALPAPAPVSARQGPRSASSAAIGGVWSLSLWLIVLLGSVAVALVGAGVVEGRRRRRGASM